MIKLVLLSFSMLVLLIFPIHDSFAESANITPIDGIIGIEKTTISMNIPSENTLPWGYVEGTIENHAQDYPVIIQISDNENPVHFAQVDVNDDGSYEYKFRVRDVSNGSTINVFSGNYDVVIYKVVYLNSNFV